MSPMRPNSARFACSGSFLFACVTCVLSAVGLVRFGHIPGTARSELLSFWLHVGILPPALLVRFSPHYPKDVPYMVSALILTTLTLLGALWGPGSVLISPVYQVPGVGIVLRREVLLLCFPLITLVGFYFNWGAVFSVCFVAYWIDKIFKKVVGFVSWVRNSFAPKIGSPQTDQRTPALAA